LTSIWFDPGIFGFLRRIGMADSKADAPFVFEGSVKSISDSNVSAVPADERTAVVQVDHVRQAPRALAGFAGKEITLRMAPNEKLSVSDSGSVDGARSLGRYGS
jgi:hypothetical protein